MASSQQTSQPSCNHYSYAGKQLGHLSSTIEKLVESLAFWRDRAGSSHSVVSLFGRSFNSGMASFPVMPASR
jgi:hypothetical protein